MTDQARVAIVLLFHGDYARKYLSACYASLRAQTYPLDLITVYLVSNGVAEDDLKLVRQIAPTARLLRNTADRGWSGGMNTGIREALNGDARYLILLSVDTVLAPDWLSRLVESADAHGTLHILQSRILLHGSDKANSLGNRIHFLGFGYCHGYGQEHSARPRAPVDYASGTAMLVKREVFERIGLFREDYFVYYEDVEFCWRARIAGYNVGFVERSVCSHNYDFQKTLGCLEHLQRNRLLTLLTLEKVGTLVVIAPCLIVAELILSAYFLTKGWGSVQIKLAKFLIRPSTWQAIRLRRQEIGRLRTRKDAEIVKTFAGHVAFPEINHPLLQYVGNPLLAAYWTLARLLIVW